MSLTYTINNVSNTPPDAQLVTLSQAQSFAAQLGGTIVNFVDQLAKGATITWTDNNGTRAWDMASDPGWWATQLPATYGGGVEMDFRLVEEQSKGQPGAWHVNPLNGNPTWVVTPTPVVPQPPAQNPPNVFPGFPGSQPAVDPNAQMRADVARILAWAIRMGA